jgi:hypothetical protein
VIDVLGLYEGSPVKADLDKAIAAFIKVGKELKVID